MFKELKNVKINIILFIILFYAIPIQHVFLFDLTKIGSFLISSAFIIGFYLKYEKTILPSIIIGVFSLNFMMYATFADETIGIALALSFVELISQLILLYSLTSLLSLMGSTKIKNPYKSFRLFIAIVVAYTITSIIATTLLAIINPDLEFLYVYFSILVTGVLSALSLAYPLILSLNYDSPKFLITPRITVNAIIYLTSLVGFSLLLFSGTIEGFEFTTYGFLFIAFFYTTVFLFNYRMIIITSLIYILLGNFILSYVLDVTPDLLQMNLLLVYLVSTSTYAKTSIQKLNRKNIELLKTNVKLEDMIDATLQLINIGNIMTTEKDFVEDYLSRLFQTAIKVFDNFDLATVSINQNNKLHFIDVYNYDIEYLNNLELPANIIKWDFEKPHLLNDTLEESMKKLGDKYYALLKSSPRIKESLRFTIKLKDNIECAFTFALTQKNPYRFTDLDIRNFTSFQRLINTFYQVNQLSLKNNTLKDDIVLSLIRTLELFDHYTGGHSEQVAHIAREIAIEMSLSEDEIYNIYWAGIVHDIGKVGIDSAIINKPDRLSMEEYDQIKQHPVFGYEILNRIDDLREIAILVKHHHEWWNGQGYPDGLKENDIPLGSQILGVADAISSMATKRPYTAIKTSKKILEELELYKSSQFSPRVCDVAVNYMKSGKIDVYFEDK